MKFNNEIFPYLQGEKFSNGLEVRISKREKNIISRFEFIEKICSDKKVVHLGCCDHVPLIETKIKNNTWLHERIFKVAEKCIGIDINQEGVDYLTKKLNYHDIFCADITRDSILFENEIIWDYLILGEILEHVDNPVDFLTNIRSKNAGKIKQIIITVPNAFTYSNFKFAKNHFETINTDHRFWFTPYTLAKVLTNAGFKIDHFCFAHEISAKTGLKAKLKIWPFLKRKLLYNKLKNYPGFRDTIIMVANF